MDKVFAAFNPIQVYYHKISPNRFLPPASGRLDFWNFCIVITFIITGIICAGNADYTHGYDDKAVMFIPEQFTFNQTIPETNTVCKKPYCYPAYFQNKTYHCTLTTAKPHLFPDYVLIYYTNTRCVLDNGDRFLRGPVETRYNNSLAVVTALGLYLAMLLILTGSVLIYFRCKRPKLQPLLG